MNTARRDIAWYGFFAVFGAVFCYQEREVFGEFALLIGAAIGVVAARLARILC